VTGAVTGVVWFDRDRDGLRDPGEWPLPGVPVELRTAGGVSALALAASATRQATTDDEGAYRFEAAPPGAYTVTAVRRAAGFGYTSDSDGDADWSVSVQVAGAATAEANFAGLGKGALTGTVYDSGTGEPIAAADVTCRWAGFDDVPGTADDVVMTVAAGAGGGFALAGLPYGAYACVGRDPVSGESSAPAAVSVLTATPTRTQLPVRLDSPDEPRELPRTGGPVLRLAVAGLSLLLAGVVAVRLTRRRA
jgi:hypothetical protein